MNDLLKRIKKINYPFSPDERNVLVQALGELMSEASENHWCAGWLIGWEDQCPQMVKDVLDGIPDIHMSLSEAMPMAILAALLGHWVEPDLDSVKWCYRPYPNKGK